MRLLSYVLSSSLSGLTDKLLQLRCCITPMLCERLKQSWTPSWARIVYPTTRIERNSRTFKL